MSTLPSPTSFDWDTGNSTKNLIKHKVTIQESEEVFFNQPLIIVEDQKHSSVEARFYGLGKTNTDRKLFLVFTIRHNQIRIISIRDMNKKETKVYETK